MPADSIRSLVRVSSESGPLLDHLLTLPSNKRSERIRSLAYMGLIVERGLLNVGAVLPGGTVLTNTVQHAPLQSSPLTTEQTNSPVEKKKAQDTFFDADDLEHLGMI